MEYEQCKGHTIEENMDLYHTAIQTIMTIVKEHTRQIGILEKKLDINVVDNNDPYIGKLRADIDVTIQTNVVGEEVNELIKDAICAAIMDYRKKRNK